MPIPLMTFSCFQVEKFKLSQSPKNALHVKFHMTTGDALDEDYNHLQVYTSNTA